MSISISYLFSALLFSIVLVLSLASWRGRLHGIWLVQALLISVLWSVFHCLSGVFGDSFSGVFVGDNLGGSLVDRGPSLQAFVDILRSFSWTLFLLKLYSLQQGVEKADFWGQRSLHCLVGGGLILVLANLIQFSTVPWRDWIPVNIVHFGPFVLVIFTLYLLEQWYRNIPREQRWAVKFLAVGLAVTFGYDFILFSEALLYGRIDPTLWAARGWVSSLMVPLIAVSVYRAKGLDESVRLSHRAAYYSTGLLLAGTYLLVMALVGYYLRWFGGSWGSAVQVVFLVLSFSSLALLVGSGKLRATIAVWISKHFFAYKYDYREEWVRANRRFAVASTKDDYYHELLQAITAPMDSRGGGLWARHGDEFVLRSEWNCERFPMLSFQGEKELLDFMQQTGWVIELEEYRRDPSRYNNIELPEWLFKSPTLWLLLPLIHQDELQGVVGLGYPRAARVLDWEDRDLLKALGGQLATLLALQSANDALTESRQFEAFNRLSAFVVHDLKNVIAQLSLVVTNAERHKHNPEFVDDALDTLANAVSRMNRLLSQLRQESQLNSCSEVVQAVAVAKAVQISQKEQRPSLVLENQDIEAKVQVEKERLVSVLCHLVQNAQEATDDSGLVKMSIDVDDEWLSFIVEDTGVGMDEEFIRTRLFKPFDTTKGRAGMGIGVYEAQQSVKSWRGHISVTSSVGEGTIFRVTLPLYRTS